MKRLFKVSVLLLLLFVIGNAARRMFVMPAIPNHKGDGKFENTSRRHGPFAVPGYSIRFPQMDLSQGHLACYKFAALPTIGVDCMLYFAIEPRDEQFPLSGKGTIWLELVDSSGAILVELKGKPSEFIWSGHRNRHLLYQFRRSSFEPDRNQQYTLKVSYETDPSLEGLRGYAYLECGGRK